MTETTTTGNLPPWPGASAVYTRLYRLLEKMGPTHVRPIYKNKKSKIISQCTVSDDMNYIIGALNKGDEETLKSITIKYLLGSRKTK